MTDGGDMAVEVREAAVVGFFLRTLCPYSFADIFFCFFKLVVVGVYGSKFALLLKKLFWKLRVFVVVVV
jgi:hypothetical protein